MARPLLPRQVAVPTSPTVRRSVALFVLATALPIWAAQTTPSPQPSDPTVYLTKTGTKYHASDCRYLSRSRIPVKLSEAAARYAACSVCKPPQLTKPDVTPATADPVVFVAKSGAKYHVETCRYVANSKTPIRLSEAAKKYGPCSVCKPPQVKPPIPRSVQQQSSPFR